LPANRSILAWALSSALSAAWAQTTGAPPDVRAGQAELAFQGYYLGGNQQDLINTTGLAIRFHELLPSIGLLSGNIEGYGSQSRFRSGENFLELRGLPFAGRYWTLTGGDFRAPAFPTDSPFNNLFVPEVDARGIRVQAVHSGGGYSFFRGQETLATGPRVAYRITVPQEVMAASAFRKLGRGLSVSGRLMQFSSSAQAIADNPYLFPPGRTAPLVRTAAAQALYTPVKRLKLYAEASRPLGSATSRAVSRLSGFVWDGALVSLKANYAHQTSLYLPLAGYFAGDRAGPFGEARFRPWKRLELFASANRYRNNVERDPSLPTLMSSTASAGVATLLPAGFSANGQLSTVRFSELSRGEDASASKNRQVSASLSRGIGRQTIQASWREIRIDTRPNAQRQRSTELGDTLQFRHFSAGGAVRYQQVKGSQRLNSLFFRGLAQVNAGPVAAYLNLEIGSDLANQTVFSTEAYRTSAVGISLRLPRRWNLQTDVFRNSLNFDLNPQNIFLLQNAVLGGLSPATASLSVFSQWSVFFRLSRQFQWGGGMPSDNTTGVFVPRASLTGTVEGVVREKALAGAVMAASIPVTLDGLRTVLTGRDGRYVFEDVPEGAHQVALALDQLPAEFDPGEARAGAVAVQPRRAARADFEVLPLSSIEGRVVGLDQAELEGIVVRLLPGARYTTTGKDGSFRFYNVREADYELTLDPASLHPNAEFQPSKIPASVRVGAAPPTAEFSYTIKTIQKPIRKVLDR
jgi:hypothetical protein